MSAVAVEIKNFQKSFGEKQVHKDVNLEIRKGECLGLFGGSGTGKSVILRSLIGLEKPDRGEIVIEGEEITGLRETQLVSVRKKVAYVFQNGALFDSMTVFDNLAYPLREHTKMTPEEIKQAIHDQLEEFGLGGNENAYPANLSGGMQKRVGLARAILLNPSIVLYDEPTAGLDPYNTVRIQEMILRLKERGVTSIFVTHDMPSAFAVCDRIALLLEGKIHGVYTMEEIRAAKSGKIYDFIHGEEP